MKRILVITLALVLMTSAVFSQGTTETAYPSHTVEMVIPASAGGGSDLMARLLVEIIREENLCSQQVEPINKPGGGGSAGQAYMNSKKDVDYAIMTINDAQTIAASVSKTRPEGNFTPIANLAMDNVLLCVPADSPFMTMQDALDAIKKNPKSITIGCADNLDKMCVVNINNVCGVEFNNVYFNSAGEIATALLGNHVEIGVFNPSECVGLVEGGKLRPLVTFATERCAAPLDNAPTFRELGFDIVYSMSRGVLGPAGMSKEAQKYWSDVFEKVVKSDKWVKGYLEQNGLAATFMPCEEYEKYYNESEANLIKAAKEIGVL